MLHASTGAPVRVGFASASPLIVSSNPVRRPDAPRVACTKRSHKWRRISSACSAKAGSVTISMRTVPRGNLLNQQQQQQVAKGRIRRRQACVDARCAVRLGTYRQRQLEQINIPHLADWRLAAPSFRSLLGARRGCQRSQPGDGIITACIVQNPCLIHRCISVCFARPGDSVRNSEQMFQIKHTGMRADRQAETSGCAYLAGNVVA